MLPVPLKPVVNEAVKIVDFVEPQPLHLRLFLVLGQDMGSDHISLLLHTEDRWWPHGKKLSRVFDFMMSSERF